MKNFDITTEKRVTTYADKWTLIMEDFFKAQKEYLKDLDINKWPYTKLFFQNNINMVYDPFYNPIISVQPMTSPLGGIAFYQPRYANTLAELPNQEIKETVEESRLSPYERAMKTESLRLSSSRVVELKSQTQPSLLAPDCISCGGDFGNHRRGCPKNK